MEKKLEKAKIVPWMNIKTGVKQFGIDVKIKDEWYHLSEDKKACLYDTRKEALQALSTLTNK